MNASHSSHALPNRRLLTRCAFRLLSLLVIALAVAPSVFSADVSPALARYVAKDHLQRVEPAQKWRPIEQIALHHPEGAVAGYAVIFEKEDEHFGAESLNEIAVEGNPTVLLARFATVITGAETEGPLILRFHRGVPAFGIELFRSNTTTNRIRTPRVVMVTPMDFRVVTDGVHAKSARYGGPATDASKSSLERLETVRDLAEAARKRRARDEQQRGQLPKAEAERLRAAERERAQQYDRRWHEMQKAMQAASEER